MRDGFRHIKFKGQFRDYQQRILDHSDRYLQDGKISIVAAPGSGKTVLGLELIRRLEAPCIIFSPTTTIRQQWGERFRELFLSDGGDFDQLFSYDLHQIRLFNSVTYQALYKAVEKVPEEHGEDMDPDCSDVDIFAVMRSSGIKTVCLDEAHHLKNEWQKALEKFIAALDKDVVVISLTATPPYDSDSAEWDRYIRTCGEVDEEIFVPELVSRNTLCPHQDYVYFNYPSAEETESLRIHRLHAVKAVEELGKKELFAVLGQKLDARKKNYEELFSRAGEYIALAVLLKHYEYEISEKLISELTVRKGLPAFRLQYAEKAIRFLLDSDLLCCEDKSEIIAVLKKNSVYEKGKAALELNEKLRRNIISSAGKLESIRHIVQSETASMGDRLRMLVLTDHIKKESITGAAASEKFDSVNVVSIFETVRRAVPGVKIGVLSGTLVILPETVDLSDAEYKKEDIPGTGYAVVDFSGSIHHAVEYIGKLFEQGKIKILIGTKSLLGEGWDAPCINSLILASFVGSFVLSNQMRGRAIRVDKNDPEKTANIWHLVTIEPPHLMSENLSERIAAYVQKDKSRIISCDYEMLKRRFDSFMGPDYDKGTVMSGIERISLIHPPYDPDGIRRINAEMLRLSAERDNIRSKWAGEVADGHFNICMETAVPKEARVPVFVFWDVILLGLFFLTTYAFVFSLINASTRNRITDIIALILIFGLGFLSCRIFKRIIRHSGAAGSVKTLGTAVYQTLCECDLVSPSAKVETVEDKGACIIALYLRNASVHDQNVFNKAMTEMLSPIGNPRYILLPKIWPGIYFYGRSFACPSVIGKKQEYVCVLARKLKHSTGHYVPVFTYQEKGREMILKCRRRSYITAIEKLINRRYKVSRWN